MDPSKFTSSAIGRIVEIVLPRSDKKDWAFLPNRFDFGWRFPEKLWPMLSDAKQAIGTLEGTGRRLPNADLLLRPLQSREALRSSSLEGTYATPADLLLFDLEPESAPMSKSVAKPSTKEVSNYGRALREGYEYLRSGPLSLMLIRQMHERLLTGVRGEDKSPGEFRKDQVYVGSDRRFIPPPPEHLLGALEDFQSCLRLTDRPYDPLVYAYMLHYQFEAIHPFRDGNGRVGRVLLALSTWLWCDLTKPWLYMSPYFDDYRDEYIDRLFRVSTHADWAGWIEFCLRGTIEQATDAIDRCERLLCLRDEMKNRVGGDGSARLHMTIDYLLEHPVLTIPYLAEKYRVTYPTAKSDVDKLVKLKILTKYDNRRPAVFLSPEIFAIAYDKS